MYTPIFKPHVEYVLGFGFTPSKGGVLLIRKTRPAWQAGKMNGVGGKIEALETIEEAMTREFMEETNIPTQESQWQLFGSHVMPARYDYEPGSYTMHLLATVLTESQCKNLEMTTDEEPIWFAMSSMGTLTNDTDAVPGLVMYTEMARNHLGRPLYTVTIEQPEN